MTGQEKTGWVIIGLILLAFWWLFNYGMSFLHGVAPSGTSVQTTMITGSGTQSNTPTVTCDTCS